MLTFFFLCSLSLQDGVISCLVCEVPSPMMNEISLYSHGSPQVEDVATGLKHALNSDSSSGDSSVVIIKVAEGQDKKKPAIQKLDNHHVSRPLKYMIRFSNSSSDSSCGDDVEVAKVEKAAASYGYANTRPPCSI